MTTYLAPEAYLPHRAPMCLIDRVMDVSEDAVRVETDTDPEGRRAPLMEAGALAPEYLIEMMAQAIGCWSGFWREVEGETPSQEEDIANIGLLLSVRQSKLFVSSVPLGTTLSITMEKQIQDGRLAGFAGYVTAGDERLAEAKVTVYQPLESELQQLFG